MKKIIFIFFLFIFISLISLILILSTIGIKTKSFNNFISKKISQTNNIKLELATINFKLDIKAISLFLETNDLKIYYKNTIIPAKNIKVYVDFISLLKSDVKVKKINLNIDQLDILQLKKITETLKPSNFTSFMNNKVKEGKLSSEIDFYLSDKNLLKNFIAKGVVSNLKANIVGNFNLNNTNFSFFADKHDVLLKNISSESGPFKIKDGDLKLKFNPEISLETNFTTNLRYNNKFIDFKKVVNNFEYVKNIIDLEANFKNTFTISFDNTYKIKKYNYTSSGEIFKATFKFKNALENYFIGEKINDLSLINAKFRTNFDSKKNNTNISGKYSINNDDPLQFSLENKIDKGLFKLKLDAKYLKVFEFDLINYKKAKGSVANFSLNLEKRENDLKIKNFNFSEKNNLILAEDVKFSNDKFLSFKKIYVKTNFEKKKNNDFSIIFGKEIKITGTHFDARNLAKFFNKKKNSNQFSKINKDIKIDLATILAPLSENLKNFTLIGKIENGKFTKISSKGNFDEKNFLDITMKKDKNSKKKYLEIYSDLPRPLLAEYNFFNGLAGGTLLFSSIIEEDSSNSKLKIENFNVINAPGMVKLLSLADLGGLADLAEGEGISFDLLEINMEKNKNLLKINELLALGPSVSVLIEGYQNEKLTSLRGTLVPAKTLNKMISKIPVLGDIIIPKEAGEGLFGVSFKIKGPPNNIKTTINPLRTLTPRFIQKIIDKSKNSK